MDTQKVGRNEPCPCGSGRKYKRCHGVDAAPQLGAPAANPLAVSAGTQPGAMPPGMENLDPAMLTQFTQALQRLPRGQMQRLQAIMQKAMAGKDVSREAEEFERTLPPEFQQMMAGFKMPEGVEEKLKAPAIENKAAVTEESMTPERARQVIEEAVTAGKMSREQADMLLQAAPTEAASEEASKWKFWKKNKG